MERNDSLLDRAYGSLIATAIGDAMGMPASFMPPSQIKRIYGRITDFVSPDAEQTAHSSVEAGGITDDTQESLIVSSVLIEEGRFDTESFVEKMREWARRHKMLESTVIGPSTRKFLETILSGGDYIEAGKNGDTNGAAMRVGPIGIFTTATCRRRSRKRQRPRFRPMEAGPALPPLAPLPRRFPQR
ncbi:hypothetical protein PACILC2_06750 [Paenibacillus cisolokensis]|uniref:ADP-ribosylglycohydrolase n=1 Tax=Paenibacillus cisolokensis TaxID=1658519 RepID=A0ABQ4N1U1_9BACL|nr:hypothetical protein PACILC2_06750 [Paenibacillus cisolokensis]